jgi:hypothetical protein
MNKENQEIASTRDWNTKNVNDNAISNFLDHVIMFADTMHLYYVNHASKKKSLSIIIRILTVLFFTISIILTYILGQTPDNQEFWITTFNISSISLASMLLLFDKVFGLSESWIRYTQSRFEIEKIVSEYHAQFITMPIENNDYSENEIKKLQMEILTNFDRSLRQTVINETHKWKIDLQTQLSTLTNNINNDLLAKRKSLEEKKHEILRSKFDE